MRYSALPEDQRPYRRTKRLGHRVGGGQASGHFEVRKFHVDPTESAQMGTSTFDTPRGDPRSPSPRPALQ